ncbi:cytochrome C [Bordetella genomosp. 9]|uniref:Cytochrome C n=2 Tax=Bordetella genomosp. 9 TaxID=1416803 RepID=A0A1W6YWK1_9BORD|nr:cytochrome C [Bordetella genomosp. 9]
MRGFRFAVGCVAAVLIMVAAGAVRAQDAAGVPLEPGTMPARLAACTACHGEQGRAGPDGYYPRLAGKPRDYLFHQLQNFRDGRRQYRPMTNLLRHLPDDYLLEIAAWFAGQHPPYPPPAPADASPATLARGRLLTTAGDPARGVPACAACHGAALNGLAPAIPGLLGLPRDYLLAQLGSWRNGTRAAAAPDCMADVARQLSPEDIGAVAAWLSSQPVPQPYQPEPAGALQPPVACGGVNHP